MFYISPYLKNELEHIAGVSLDYRIKWKIPNMGVKASFHWKKSAGIYATSVWDCFYEPTLS